MKGRIVVGAVIIVALITLGGTVAYRGHARQSAAADLSDPSLRERAFRTLLRMNGLQGLANDYAHDARPERRGKAFLRGTDAEGKTLLVVRGAKVTAPGTSQPAAFVFREDGGIVGYFEGAEIHVSKDGASAILVGEPEKAEPDHRSLVLLSNRCREALRIRGPFALETVEGTVTFRDGVGPSPPDLPLFAYDHAAACFRGPPGGPREAWEVIPERSPLFQPAAR